MNLDAYFRRTGATAPAQPDLTGLNRLIAAHVATIPFSNVEILRGQPVVLDPEAVFDKLVARQRGGYCFEQNGLFARVLGALGYDVTPVGGRVTLRAPVGEVQPITHMALLVRLGDTSWIADVGFGGLSPSAALRLQPDLAQDTPHDTRRLRALPGGAWVQEVRIAGAWAEIYRFTLEQMHRADQELGNWWTWAHPDSHFRRVLTVARAAQDGTRLTLTEQALTRRARDGQEDSTPVTTRAQALDILARDFGLHYGAGTRLAMPGVAWAQDQ